MGRRKAREMTSRQRWLRRLCAAAGISQADLADACGLHRTSLHRWAARLEDPVSYQAQTAADRFGAISPERLIEAAKDLVPASAGTARVLLDELERAAP